MPGTGERRCNYGETNGSATSSNDASRSGPVQGHRRRESRIGIDHYDSPPLFALDQLRPRQETTLPSFRRCRRHIEWRAAWNRLAREAGTGRPSDEPVDKGFAANQDHWVNPRRMRLEGAAMLRRSGPSTASRKTLVTAGEFVRRARRVSAYLPAKEKFGKSGMMSGWMACSALSCFVAMRSEARLQQNL